MDGAGVVGPPRIEIHQDARSENDEPGSPSRTRGCVQASQTLGTIHATVPHGGRSSRLALLGLSSFESRHKPTSLSCPALNSQAQGRATAGGTRAGTSPTVSTDTPFVSLRASGRRSGKSRFARRLSHKYLGPTTFCTAATRSRFGAESFRSRRVRLGRQTSSCDVDQNCSCHFRTTALVCATASALSRQSGSPVGSRRHYDLLP
jgi:hypothetical protein